MSQEVFQVVKRSGDIASFDPSKIEGAVLKAFKAVEGGKVVNSDRVHEAVQDVTRKVVESLADKLSMDMPVHIEEVQNKVELMLMSAGHYDVARAYIVYREAQKVKRGEPSPLTVKETVKPTVSIMVSDKNGNRIPLDMVRVEKLINEACAGLEGVDSKLIFNELNKNLFDGMKLSGVQDLLVMTARTLIETDPNYSYVASRLLQDNLRGEALSYVFGVDTTATHGDMAKVYADYFPKFIAKGIENEHLTKDLLGFDLEALGAAIDHERDQQFTYLSIQTLYDRYFIHDGKTRYELPQAMYMRVAMGLALNEDDKNARAIEFYNLLASFDFMSSTPTLFNAATNRSQLSSCYLTHVPDDLAGIYGAITDNALLSKFAGGLGNDWTQVRSLGSHIKGTNGESQGVIPFLKVANDTAVAVNQGGKRKGAVCAYLETWHLDIEEFLDLRKNTGDDRRRTHDMNTANWIPDLFMKRVVEEGEWTLFSPNDVPDLHDLYGKAFEEAYVAYEAKAASGEIKLHKKIQAVDLWRKMLGQLFETGHPWITFKDPSNLRSPQQHVGVVHSSNLCTEITLNTSVDEIAVCNLGSVNLVQHVNSDGTIDKEKLKRTVTTAMRMLDNVIDINYYSVPQAKYSNMRHRPVGMGIMGFHDALFKMHMAYQSEEALTFADESMEAISYYAIEASSNLAVERGSYETFKGSLWDQGILPIDSIDLLVEGRGEQFVSVNRDTRLDWDTLRAKVQRDGMRNSNTMAIAPTATISNICGVSQSIEPVYQNLYVKSNLSGEFMVVNEYLVRDLKALDMWDEVMVSDLKYFDGRLEKIKRIPENLKAIYATAFEMDTRWLIEAASRRQKWIDQGQSLNLYIDQPSGKILDNIYKLAWARGLKTTYYLRSMAATGAEKSSDRPEAEAVPVAEAVADVDMKEAPAKFCSILEPDCEACQ